VSPFQRKKQDISLIALADEVFAIDPVPANKSHSASAPRPSKAAAAASRAAPAPAKQAANLPGRQHVTKSPTGTRSREFSPDMSLRPSSSSATLLSSENISPLQANRSAAAAASPQALHAHAHTHAAHKAVFVQEEDGARGPQRPPIRRSKTNFLIPVYSSEEAEDD
jgi:hypothetical protein